MNGPARSCGPCTFCCKVMGVEELDKPLGAACPHCLAGRGCGIYETRPKACRSFECVWLMDPEMPHRFRPDQTKVVLDLDHDGARLIARCDQANPMAWRRNPIYAALKAYARREWWAGKIVMAIAGRRAWLVAPDEDVELGEIDPTARVEVSDAAGRIEVKLLQP